MVLPYQYLRTPVVRNCTRTAVVTIDLYLVPRQFDRLFPFFSLCTRSLLHAASVAHMSICFFINWMYFEEPFCFPFFRNRKACNTWAGCGNLKVTSTTTPFHIVISSFLMTLTLYQPYFHYLTDHSTDYNFLTPLFKPLTSILIYLNKTDFYRMYLNFDGRKAIQTR